MTRDTPQTSKRPRYHLHLAGAAVCLLVASAFLTPPRATRAAGAASPDPDPLSTDFATTIQPFVQTYCVSCHNPDKSKGDLDLTRYTNVDLVARDFNRWQLLRERLEANEMPPEKAAHQPSPAERAKVEEWVIALRKHEAKRNAGDPGPVVARRLSNAEYDNTIRDLTGVDLHPAREFPVDPANEAGFDNSAESLTMTPGLLKKYLQAARDVADHLVLNPDGLAFAPHPVVADTDRDKYSVNRILAFYRAQKTDYADYFFAAWRYRNRAALGQPNATLADVARDAGVSPKYLATIWSTLNERPEQIGPIAALQATWRGLPAGGEAHAAAARTACERMRDFTVAMRHRLVPTVANLHAPRVNDGSQPLVLWKDRQMAANRRRYTGGALAASTAAATQPTFSELPPAAARAMAVPKEPAAAKAFEATFDRFCSTFPDAFYVSERARVFLDEAKEKKEGLVGRYLSAGFHNQMGYFRDDAPLCDLLLDDAQRRELDQLWKDFDYAAAIPWRQYSSFLWYERAESSFINAREFDFARAEDPDCNSEPKMRKLEAAYLDKAVRLGASPLAQQAMRDYFKEMSARARWVEQTRSAAESAHLRDLAKFAERAYRRPPSPAERQALVAFYQSLRKQGDLSHEDAVRDALASVLMSPSFCYRLDLPRQRGAAPGVAGSAVQPLDDYALASRLSYFLWASMPDQPLLDLAAAGKLHQPEVLVTQANRLLRDPRARGFATEFAGNWLDFRRFQQHNGVDRQRFPAFTNDLRESMFEEPIRFLLDLARRPDASVLDLLYGDYTFVNPALARHYGIPVPAGTADDQWFRVDRATQYGRGGLLPMAVFLTNNSPGLRTSPVKRGNWVVKRLLGEHIPPPPAKVPELPTDEAKLDLPLRDVLARHRADPTCAACHARFDSMGLVFEGYGPVGERRDVDLGGKPVDSAALFPGGSQGAGLDGLRTYIRAHRQRDFVDQLCRQLLAYGLGRTLLPSDDDTVDAMRAKLEAHGYRFGALIETVVNSPQFLNKRANAEVTQK